MIINFARIRNELEKRLYDLEQHRKRAIEIYTPLETDRLDKEIEETQNELNKVMEIIAAKERQERRDQRTYKEFEQLLGRLGLKSKEPYLYIKGIDIAECLLAGYEMKGHSFYKMLHSEDPAQQKRAEKDVRLLKRYIKLCERAQLNY